MKTERKLMVIGLVCLLVSIAFGSAFAVTRTITSTGDSFDTYIRNSKGNYWTATGANLQLAVNDLTTGGTVWLPAGTIYLPDSFYVTYNHTAIIGAGMYQTTIKMGIATAVHGFYCFNKHDIVLSGFTYHGNNSGLSGGGQTNSHGIDIRATKNLTMRDIRILYPAGEGLVFGDGTYDTWTSNGKGVEDFTVDNLVVQGIYGTGAHHGILLESGTWGVFNNVKIDGSYNVGDGIDINDLADNVTFNNLFIDNVTGDCMKVNGCNELIMNNVHFNQSHTGLKVFTNARTIIVNGLYINCHQTAIFLYQTGGFPCIINDFNINVSGGTVTEAVAFNGGQSNISFSNGYISGADDYGVYLTTSSNISFDNVHFSNNHAGSIYVLKSAYVDIEKCDAIGSSHKGLYLHHANHTKIADCKILKNTEWGIYIEGSNNVSVTDSEVRSPTSSGAYGGMRIMNSSGLRIEDNSVLGCHESILMDNTYCNNYLILGNYVAGNTHVPHNATGATWCQVFHNGPQIPT